MRDGCGLFPVRENGVVGWLSHVLLAWKSARLDVLMVLPVTAYCCGSVRRVGGGSKMHGAKLCEKEFLQFVFSSEGNYHVGLCVSGL